MAREKMTITIDPQTREHVDADADADGVSRSEYVTRVLRHEHYRRLLARVESSPMSPKEEQSLRGLLAWQAAV
jgi:hypothetical protein